MLTRSASGHEVVSGPTGSGKTRRVRSLLVEDEAANRKIWIIDPVGGQSLPEWKEKAARFASEINEAQELLAELLDITRHDAWSREPITVTIETAQHVFDDEQCRRLIEKILSEAHGDGIRFRMVVNVLDLRGFGYSQKIRAAIFEGAEVTLEEA